MYGEDNVYVKNINTGIEKKLPINKGYHTVMQISGSGRYAYVYTDSKGASFVDIETMTSLGNLLDGYVGISEEFTYLAEKNSSNELYIVERNNKTNKTLVSTINGVFDVNRITDDGNIIIWYEHNGQNVFAFNKQKNIKLKIVDGSDTKRAPHRGKIICNRQGNGVVIMPPNADEYIVAIDWDKGTSKITEIPQSDYNTQLYYYPLFIINNKVLVKKNDYKNKYNIVLTIDINTGEQTVIFDKRSDGIFDIFDWHIKLCDNLNYIVYGLPSESHVANKLYRERINYFNN